MILQLCLVNLLPIIFTLGIYNYKINGIDYKKESNNTERSDEKSIHLKFENNDLDNESNALVGATFSDENTSQSVKIRITGRTRTQTHQNLKRRFWYNLPCVQ